MDVLHSDKLWMYSEVAAGPDEISGLRATRVPSGAELCELPVVGLRVS